MSPYERLILLGLAATVLMVAAAVILHKVRMTPAERERRRRVMLNRIGRMSDGVLTDVSESALFYTYTAMGVEYETSQDVSALADYLPGNWNTLIGTVTLKYSLRNPANSIVVCEEWSGVRRDAESGKSKSRQSSSIARERSAVDSNRPTRQGEDI